MIKIEKRVFIAMLCFAAVILFFSAFHGGSFRIALKNVGDDVRDMELGGEYTTSDGREGSFTFPFSFPSMKAGETINASVALNQSVPVGAKIMFFSRRSSVKVMFNGEELLGFGEKGTFSDIFNSPGNAWNFIISPGFDVGDELLFEITPRHNNVSATISHIYIASKFSMFIKVLTENFANVILGFMLILLGVILVAAPYTGGFYLSLCCVFGGVWFCTSTGIANFFLSSIFVKTLDSIAFYCLPVSFTFYVMSITSERKNLHFSIWVSLVYLFSVFALQMLGIYDLYQSIEIFHITIVINALAIAHSLIASYARNRTKRNLVHLVSALFVLLGSALDLINYYFNFLTAANFFTNVGIFALIIVEFATIMRQHSTYLYATAKHEALVNLAYKDALTGVRNRLSYEERLSILNLEEEKNCGIGVLDINALKVVNDKLGHNIGDEVIVNCCKVICDTFGRSEVYRIGSDEFAVIFTPVQRQIAEDAQFELDHNIEKFNKERSPDTPSIGVSFGYAFFDPEQDQNYDTVFERADKEMYSRKPAR